jgi:hypothetical protein
VPANNNTGNGVLKPIPGTIKALQCGAHSSGTYPDCICDKDFHHTTSRTVCVPEIVRLNPGATFNPNLTLKQGPALNLRRGRALPVLR